MLVVVLAYQEYLQHNYVIFIEWPNTRHQELLNGDV